MQGLFCSRRHHYFIIAAFVAVCFLELQIQFAQFDRDSDGVISQQELAEVMTSLGLKIDSEAVKKVVQRADVDGM